MNQKKQVHSHQAAKPCTTTTCGGCKGCGKKMKRQEQIEHMESIQLYGSEALHYYFYLMRNSGSLPKAEHQIVY